MKVFLIALIIGLIGLAHESRGQSDSTGYHEKQPFRLRGYVGGVFERSVVSPVHTNSLGLQMAVLLKKHWQLGLYGTQHTGDNYREQLIFPNSFQMNYKHGGLLVGYRTNLEKKYEFNLETKAGWGEVKWDEYPAGNVFLIDKFRTLQLQLSVDYVLTKFLALNGFAGYRWMNELDITGLTNEDFQGVYYGIVAKVGLFR